MCTSSGMLATTLTGELEVGGPTTDALFENSGASITINLPKHPTQRSGALLPKVVTSNPSEVLSEHTMTPSIVSSFQDYSTVAWNAPFTVQSHRTPTTSRQWPRASDYFTQFDDSGLPESTSALVQTSDSVSPSLADDVVTTPVAECQQTQSVNPPCRQTENSSNTPSHPSRNDRAMMENHQIASQFLRGLVALINEVRNENTPVVSAAPTPTPAVIMQPAGSPPHQQSTRNISDPTHDDHKTAKGQTSHGDQLRHLDALEAARLARLALKEQYEDEVSGTSTGHDQTTKATVSHDMQPQLPNPRLTPPYSMPTALTKSDDMTLASSCLLESITDGKITLNLNSMANDCSPCRLLYQTCNSGAAGLTQCLLETSSAAPSVKTGIMDMVMERTVANYRLLVQAYHHLKLRKAALVEEWKSRNPTRVHSLSTHCYETKARVAPNPRQKKPQEGLMVIERAYQEEYEPGEITEGQVVQRRLFFTRGNHALGRSGAWADNATYINVCTGVHSKKVKKKSRAIILPESEDVYARLAWFVRNVSEQDWVAAQPNSKKRASQDAHDGPGPRKKAKLTVDTLDGVNMKQERGFGDIELSVQKMNQGDVVPKHASVVLTQTAVVVLLNEG
ncbi:hypothetical protein BR93DRAFT_929496 [Coniochaeta sp. PMI_546]|nr:hypothetical protein BR93DRAFT_929496 [Coniochaeta sp. PMI_546]